MVRQNSRATLQRWIRKTENFLRAVFWFCKQNCESVFLVRQLL